MKSLLSAPARQLVKIAYAVLDYGRPPTLHFDIDSAVAAAGSTGRVCECVVNTRDDRQDSAVTETAEEVKYHVLAGCLENGEDT